MGTIFDSKKSIFKKSKALMTDGCCEVPEPCCGVSTGLRGYKVFYGDGNPTPIEINNASTFLTTINTGTKWGIYLDDITGSVTVTAITVTPAIADLNIAITPLIVPSLGNTILSANWATTGTRIFSVSVTTDSGNFSFNAQIKVL
jgi:hypothetical protein